MILLFAFFLILLWRSPARAILRYGFLSLFILLIVFSSGWLAYGLTHKLENPYPPVTNVSQNIHWVVVLSAGQAEIKNFPINDLVYGSGIKRLIEGLRIYRQLPQSKILLSGGGFDYEIPEATNLAELAIWFKIPAKDLVLEKTSKNTIGQIKAIKQLIHDEPFYLVTSAIHMPRSLCLCRTYGLNPIAAPTDYTFYWNDKLWPIRYLPNTHNLFYLSIAMHEILGKTWAKIKGDC
ncbi:MAG: YdcF family protein [Tatlockia sp.]|nr:YdcF family protein [Tatlockia sp.]